MTTKIALVDDHAIVRHGVANLLGGVQGFKIVGLAGTAAELFDLLPTAKPDVVVMDINLPDVSGIDTTKQLLAEAPSTRVVALSAYSDRVHVVGAFRAGAMGYVVKDCAVDELVTAIRTVDEGGRYMSPSIANLVLSGLATRHEKTDTLTEREREVLRLLADGKAMKQAAIELRISTKTVETHRRSIMEKLQLYSVAELTKHAIREGYSSLN